MSFGNSGSNIDTSGYSFDGGLGSYGNSGFESVPIGALSTDNNGYEVLGNLANSGLLNGDSGALKGNWFNTLGRLGTGILGALGDYDASSNQQAYIPYTQWLGNGLAKFSAINNTANKQNQQNQAYGNTLMLSSLFGPGKSLLSKFGGQIGRNYNEEMYNG